MPDWSKVLDAAKGAVNSGMGQITSQMTDVVTKLDTKIMTAETEFNSSLNTYNTFANATETLANNVSKFQALIQNTVSKYVPFYSEAMQQFTNAVSTTKSLIGAMGQKDLSEKLEALETTATEKLKDLSDTSGALATKVMQSTSDEYGDTLGDLKEKLGHIASTSNQFREDFNGKLQSFTGVLEEPLKVALGESASTQIMSLTSKTQAMLGHLQQFAGILKGGLTTAADDVDFKLKTAANKGWFKRVFGGLFR